MLVEDIASDFLQIDAVNLLLFCSLFLKDIGTSQPMAVYKCANNSELK